MALSSASACFRCANSMRKASAEQTKREPNKYFRTCAPLSDRIPDTSAKKYRTKSAHPTGINARASVLRGGHCYCIESSSFERVRSKSDQAEPRKTTVKSATMLLVCSVRLQRSRREVALTVSDWSAGNLGDDVRKRMGTILHEEVTRSD